MASVTLRPNGTQFVSGSLTLVGAATYHAALSDDLDSSYAECVGANGGGVRLDMTTFTLPPLAQVRTIEPRIRAALVTAGTRRMQLMIVPPFDGNVITLNSTAIALWTSAPSNHFGDSQATIDALTLAVNTNDDDQGGPPTFPTVRVYEAYYVVVYNEAPVAAVTAPTGTVTTTSAPPVTWTYTDPEGDAQERYQAKIFSAAQYGIGGFDPETSPYTWSSGEVFSAALSATPAALPNDTYRAYVKVADVGSSGRYGAWAFSGFVAAAVPPPTPTLVAAADAALSRVRLDATVGTYATGTQPVYVERSVDGGVTWTPVRGASGVVTANLATFTVYDYEMPRGLAVSYRARVVAVISGFPVASAYSTAAAVTVTPSGWWLKDPQFPALNMQIRVGPGSFALRRRIPQQVYQGLGAPTATVVTDGAKGDEGTIDVWSMTAERWAKLDALLATGRPLLLEDALGRAWFIQIGDSSQSTLIQAKPTAAETTSTGHVHAVTLPWTETTPPTGTTQGAGTPTG